MEAFTKAVVAASLIALATGCPAPLSREARMQDAAQDFNHHARFGRAAIAIERVAPTAREAYVKSHKDWGGDVRIADSEMAGMKLTSDEEAEVSVRVAWFRPDENELHVTLLRQKWHDNRGTWLLVGEEKAEGDGGLLGDKLQGKNQSDPAHERAQFPTIRIGNEPE